MAPRSKLLQILLSETEQVGKDLHTERDADIFIATLLNKLIDYRDNGYSSLKSDAGEVEGEVNEILSFFTEKGLSDLDAAALTASEYVRSCEDRSEAISLLRQTMISAQLSAGKDKDTAATTLLYLKKIFVFPTSMLKQLLAKDRDRSSADAAARRDASFSSFFQDEEEPEQEETAEEETERETEPSDATDGDDDLLKTTSDKATQMQSSLSEVIFGQEYAINAFTTAYFQSLVQSDLATNRKSPKAVFLFAGPSGVGKTFLAEEAAKRIGLPFRRFDMSEYSDKETSAPTFLGITRSYKGAKAGLVTEFVAEHPRCVLLFDELEKAHLNVIHFFLQILDDGKLKDSYTEKEVSFRETIVIFTTNAGKKLYEDTEAYNLSTSFSQKSVLRALAADKNPTTGAPYFPAAMCSRFASGNIVVFNRLGAHHLLRIAKEELSRQRESFAKIGLSLSFDDKIPYCLLYELGGTPDARAVRNKALHFVYEELRELYRLLPKKETVPKISEVRFLAPLPDREEVQKLFVSDERPEILLFAEGPVADACLRYLDGLTVHVAEYAEDAKKIIFENVVSMILCDPRCHTRDDATSVLNVDDLPSEGRDFIEYLRESVPTPHYLLQRSEGEINPEEFLTYSQYGARGLLTIDERFRDNVLKEFSDTLQQARLTNLSRANKALRYKTSQQVWDDGKTAVVTMFDFALKTAVDAEDAEDLVSDVSRPSVTYADVIGAKDAKEELSYFVEFMRDPSKFVRHGVKSPKGILLYGPPGTGKTLLAKATAGESNVTFIATEGNTFFQKGADEVHAVFRKARKYAPSILFIDEIDAIAKARGSGMGEVTGNILTAFLTEMDGFKTNTDKPVFVLAATNYPVDPEPGQVALDPALMRRFDRRILVDLPDKNERLEFIRMKMRKNASIRLTDDQVANIAGRSVGMSLAALDSVFELALRTAIRSDDFLVTDKILEDAFETYNGGEIKKWTDDSLLRTARHESGHALMCRLGGEKPAYLTVVARGNHGGYMQHADKDDKGTYRRSELLDLIRTALGGRAAEVLYYGEEDGIDTGASADLRYATNLTESMICRYGMDPSMGMATINPEALYRSSFYEKVHERVNSILREEFSLVLKTLQTYQPAIDALVDALLEQNSLKEEEIERILAPFLPQGI